ncbi:MAG: hypothetical protein IJC02_11095 [Lachnospiraceae bacterium]|nr:hypothetical protein [Lachnospiraceae bacterium]
MIIQILILVCGIYMIYWAMQMKLTNKIPEMLTGKGFPINRAVNPEGFMKKTFPVTLGMGILLFVAGMIGGLKVLVFYPMADTILMIALLVALSFYGKFLLKAQKKYLVGIVDEKRNNKTRKRGI